jgi:hypothetical protein
VFGVLLGPLIDRRLEPFVFGNRIYRSLGQDRDNLKAWKRRPYELDARQLYMPYRRDYALFRRVAHWSAAAMVGSESRAVDVQGEEIAPDHFEHQAIPACCRPSWWKKHQLGEGYWARLDLKMAFPCVTRALLTEGFEHVLQDPEEFGEADWLEELSENDLDGYPRTIKRALLDHDLARTLCESFFGIFDEIRYASTAITDDHWRPDDADGLLVRNHPNAPRFDRAPRDRFALRCTEARRGVSA